MSLRPTSRASGSKTAWIDEAGIFLSARLPACVPAIQKKRKRKKNRGATGFTLLEVLVAATVLWIGIAGSLSGFQTVNSVYRDQRHMTQALQIAEGVAEELLCFTSSDDYLQSGTHPEQAWQYDANAQRVSENGRYRVTWLVVPNVPVAGVRKIDVRVAWDDGDERDFTLSIHR
jgi:prepilin-type N-terminal cleavage/methylation domain-containing protein